MAIESAPTQVSENLAVSDAQIAIKELVRVFSCNLSLFHHCAFRVLGNSADAEDAVQEALLSACKHLHQFRGQSQLSTWLTAIVRNCARMQLRRRPRYIHLPLHLPLLEQGYLVCESVADPKPNPEDECLDSERAEKFRECTEQLSPSLRRTFQLRVVEGLSICETAQRLKLPVGTVKAQLSRARGQLARQVRRALIV